MTGDERLTLIQLALGKVSVAFMRQSGKVVMPTEALLETAQEIGRLWSDEIATLRAENARLTAECEALRADVVWAIRNAAEWFDDNVIVWQTEGSRLGEAKFDGTDADIVRAVREAREG